MDLYRFVFLPRSLTAYHLIGESGSGLLKVTCPLLAHSGHVEMRNRCRYWGKADMAFCGAHVRL
jgi:hypothetical protein